MSATSTRRTRRTRRTTAAVPAIAIPADAFGPRGPITPVPVFTHPTADGTADRIAAVVARTDVFGTHHNRPAVVRAAAMGHDRKHTTAVPTGGARDPHIAAAGRFARYGLHAFMPTFRGTDRRPPAASASDIIAIRGAIDAALAADGSAVVPDAIVRVTGYRNIAALIAAARGDDGSSTDPIRGLTDANRARIGGPRVSWQTGRWAAGIAAAYAIETAIGGPIPDPRTDDGRDAIAAAIAAHIA